MGVAKLVFLFVSVTISVIHGAEKKVKVPILECNFDDGLCPGWEHDESEEYRWKLQSGPAKDIGPQYDYTRGNDEGQYIYLDDEGKKSGKGIIRSPVMDLSQKKKHCLRFVYYARGTYPGEFRIFHSSHMRGRPLSIFNRAGPQSDNDTHWIFEDISIPLWSTGKNFDKVRFAFQAMKGRGDNNVLALDDVSVTPGSCPKFQLSRTATTATFGPSTVPPTGFVDGEVVDQTNEEVMKRNQKMIEENEERNRMIQEKNNMLNSGQAYTQDPNQPTQPTQPTQPQQTTMNPVNQTQLEIERQERIKEQQRQVREEAERKMKEEQERIAKAEKERKEKIEKMRKEQKEKMLKQREEEAKRMKAIQEKQKEERMRKQKEEEKRRELEKQKKIEDQRKKKQRHEESQKN
uniref:PH domain-containing protein DDB_G0287875-like n=1 Tax=Styela clava TaxID=7725 RepID=UPI001939F5FB|nr:PH domain-containing protein DDB_G0287875-like [Styela clava]